jgi:hypothetical protein
MKTGTSKPDTATLNATYVAALDAFRLASHAYRAAADAYRARTLGDNEFVIARNRLNAATTACDAAEQALIAGTA